MNRDKLKIAIAEAERFLAKAKSLPKPHKVEQGDWSYTVDTFPVEQGAIKRSSMDLTRALADLRRPG